MTDPYKDNKMKNQFSTESFKALALNVLPVLKNQLRLPALVDNRYDAKRVSIAEGSTISVKRPVVFSAKDFVSTIEVQDIKRKLVDIKLNTFKDISFELTAEQVTFIMDNDKKRTEELLKPAFAALADATDEKIASLWKEQIPFYIGDPAKAADIATVIQARKSLVDRKVPKMDRKALFGTSAYAQLLGQQGFRDLNKVGDTKALKEASLGHKFGLDMYETETNINHIVGAAITAAAGAITSSAVSVATVAVDGQDIVNSEFNTIPLTGLGAGTVNKGELFSITQGGKVFQFVVKEEVTSAGAAASVKAFPVYRDATGAVIVFASGSTLEFAGKVVGSYDKSVAFQKQAFAYVPVSLPNMGGFGVSQTVVSADEISFRITSAYDIHTKTLVMSVDFLAGFATLYPELATIIIGG